MRGDAFETDAAVVEAGGDGGERGDDVDALVERRDATFEALSAQGWQLPQPHGNFVWLPLGDETAAVAATLLAAGLVTRAFPPEGIRVSIGEAEAMEALLAASADIVSSLPAGHPARKAH